MSKREQTTTVEDLLCDQAPCELIAAGPCVFCQKDLCLAHGEVGVRYSRRNEHGEPMGQVAALICSEDRDTPISMLFTPDDRVQRRFDEFNMAKAVAIGAPIAGAEG